MPTFFVVVQDWQILFLFCLREEKVIFAIRTRTDANAVRKSLIPCKKKYHLHKVKLINNVLSKSKGFITYLVRSEYHQKRNLLTKIFWSVRKHHLGQTCIIHKPICTSTCDANQLNGFLWYKFLLKGILEQSLVELSGIQHVFNPGFCC